MDAVENFKAEMAAHGYSPGEVIPGGKIHRFSMNGIPHDKTGWYWITAGGPVTAGVFGHWWTGEKIKWSSKSKSGMSSGELKAYRAAVEEAKRQREAERRREHETASEKAIEDIKKFRDAPADHPYLEKKRVKPYGIKICGNELIIPFKDVSGKFWTYQRTKANGEKLFLTGGKKRGCYFSISDYNQREKARGFYGKCRPVFQSISKEWWIL